MEGYDESKKKWYHLSYLPYPLLHKKWQWYLLEMLREELSTNRIEDLADYCYKKYPNGFVANVQKGDVPNRYEGLTKYVVSPPISVSRIEEYRDGKVTCHYKSHRTKKVEKETVDVLTFIGRMVQHIFPKGFKRIRYYGIQATKTFEKVKAVIQEPLSLIKHVVKDAVKIIPTKNYRERYIESIGKAPFKCKRCDSEMAIYKIWHPKYGVIYDELKKILAGGYESGETVFI